MILQADVFASGGADELFLIARAVFGLTLAYMGLGHFLALDQMTGYAEYSGVPAPRFGVIASGAMLVLGGLGITVGAFPVLAAGALLVFLLVSAFVVHDYWSIEDPEDRQNEQVSFQKNIYGAAASLAFLVFGNVDWPYALNIGLF